VKPTRSAKRTDTTRRSATGDALRPGATALGTGAEAFELPVSGVAHSEQNLAPGGLAKPHCGHAAARGAAQSLQNFAPARFSLPQLGQINPTRPLALLDPVRIPGHGR
jgi:hypothetical protein